jgi:ribosomal protein S18 acetylase RimI-like enzyme
MQAHIRPATSADIPRIQIIRHLVTENILSDPALVTDQDVHDYLHQRGRGWVATVAGQIVGFAIVDFQDHNVWALFLDPAFERRGIGRQLHDTLLDGYFDQSTHTLWLGTEPGTRAQGFYQAAGWTVVGTHGKGEIKFEMTHTAYLHRKTAPKS